MFTFIPVDSKKLGNQNQNKKPARQQPPPISAASPAKGEDVDIAVVPTEPQDKETRRNNQRIRRQIFIDNVVSEVLDFRWLSRRKERAKRNKYHNFIVNGVWPSSHTNPQEQQGAAALEHDDATVATTGTTTTTAATAMPDEYFYVLVPPESQDDSDQKASAAEPTQKYLEITHPRTNEIVVVPIPPGIQPGETFPVPWY